jgi:hypothetical protein
MSKNNIHITRYTQDVLKELPPEAFCKNGQFPWELQVEPEDGEWLLLVPRDKTKEPRLWVKVGSIAHGDGTGEDAYAEVGSPEHEAFLKGEAPNFEAATK